MAAKGKKRHVKLPARLPIQGKEEMQGFLYLVWKEIFATVNSALCLNYSPLLLSATLLAEQPPGHRDNKAVGISGSVGFKIRQRSAFIREQTQCAIYKGKDAVFSNRKGCVLGFVC